MADYIYEAVSSSGRLQKGRISAEGEEGAQAALTQAGLFVVSLREIHLSTTIWRKPIYFGAPVSVHDLAVYCRQLATLLRAGVAVLDALSILYADTHSAPLKEAISGVIRSVEAGSSLSKAYADQPRFFPPLVVHMIMAGEISGRMDAVFDLMASYYERRTETEQKVKSAIMYPVILSGASILVAVFIMVAIVPTFVGAFAQFGEQLPWTTRLVMGVSGFLQQFWWVLGGLGLMIVVGHRMLSQRYVSYRLRAGDLLFRLPIFGSLSHKSIMAQTTRIAGLLLASGVPILDVIEAVSETVTNEQIKQALRKSGVSLEGGQRWSEALGANRWISPFLVQMVTVGEQTGHIDVVMSKAADFYESEVQIMADRMQSLIEPILVVFLAVVVGILVLAVLMPTFQLVKTVH